MPYLQFIVPDLGYTAAAKQVSLIAPALDEPGWSSGVYPLTRAGRAGPFVDVLRANHVTVLESTGRSVLRWFGLRNVVPAPGRGIVHAYGLKVLRQLRAATLGRRRPPIILTLTGRERLSWLDRRCLRIVNRMLVHHRHAADALIGQGIPANRVSVIPPAVSCGTGFQPVQGRQVGNLSHGTTLLVTAGSMPDRFRLLKAVWAFEFIRYPHEGAHLLVVGDGPGRAALEDTARGMAPEGSRVHFLGERSDLSALLRLADVVLVLQPYGGVNFALEAMAAGRAVVAANTPDLAAVIRDGETGRLVPPQDAAAAASVIRNLLLDPAERHQLGDAARQYVRERHAVEMVVRMLETVYGDEFTSTRSGLGAE
jgi:glycosyltransferase involved in cell wall biosynthesis